MTRRLSKNQAEVIRRRRHYAELRDQGMTPQQAIIEVGVTSHSGERQYERWYQSGLVSWAGERR